MPGSSNRVYYVFFKALVARLGEGSQGSANTGIVTGVLVTVGDLARVVGQILFVCFWSFTHNIIFQ